MGRGQVVPLGAAHGATLKAAALWAAIDAALLVPATATTFNTQNLRGQTLLFRCLETGFVTTAPALGRYQRGRGIDPSRRELVGERPADWIKGVPTTTCDHCGMVVKGNQWAFRQHLQSKRCQQAQSASVTRT